MAKQPEVHEKIVSNVWFHTMKFEKAGDFKLGHKHNHSHAHLVCQGSIEAFEITYGMDGTMGTTRVSLGVFKQGDMFEVPANKSHSIVALEDGTMGACIQAVRDEETNDIVSCFCDDKGNATDKWDAPISKITL